MYVSESVMKSVVLFYVVIAILNTVHCAEMSISDMENPKIDDKILKVIQHLFCNGKDMRSIIGICDHIIIFIVINLMR